MKIILTESQVERLIIEQSELSFDRRFGTAAAAEKSNAGNRQMVNAVLNMDPHTRNELLAFGAAFIPVVGPFVSMGIATYDAKTLWDEGHKKEAALTFAFGMLPLVSKIPIFKQIGTKGISTLARKIVSGSAELTALEKDFILALKTHPEFLHTVKEHIRNKAIASGINVATDVASKKL